MTTFEIFIVAYHAKQDLSRALASIALHSRPGYRLTVYENGGNNYPLTWLWNRFMEQSRRDVVAICNPDIIVGPGWDTEALACLEDPTVAAVNPMSTYIPHWRGRAMPFPEDFGLDMIESVTAKVREIFKDERFFFAHYHELLVGSCYILSRSAWNRLGGFDESLPFGGNEYEFNRRALGAGMKLGVCSHAVAWHKWNASARDAINLGTFDPAAWKPRFNAPPEGADFRSA